MKTNNDFDKRVGQQIRQLRENKKMTQAELGEKLGVTKNAVYSWETGKCKLTLKKAKEISRALDCEVDDLLK